MMTGFLKNEIVALSKWNKDKSEINSADIVCAYVGAVHQLLAKNNPNEWNQQNQNVSAALQIFINRNYGNLVSEQLNNRGYTKSTIFKKIVDFPLEQPPSQPR